MVSIDNINKKYFIQNNTLTIENLHDKNSSDKVQEHSLLSFESSNRILNNSKLNDSIPFSSSVKKHVTFSDDENKFFVKKQENNYKHNGNFFHNPDEFLGTEQFKTSSKEVILKDSIFSEQHKESKESTVKSKFENIQNKIIIANNNSESENQSNIYSNKNTDICIPNYDYKCNSTYHRIEPANLNSDYDFFYKNHSVKSSVYKHSEQKSMDNQIYKEILNQNEDCIVNSNKQIFYDQNESNKIRQFLVKMSEELRKDQINFYSENEIKNSNKESKYDIINPNLLNKTIVIPENNEPRKIKSENSKLSKPNELNINKNVKNDDLIDNKSYVENKDNEKTIDEAETKILDQFFESEESIEKVLDKKRQNYKSLNDKIDHNAKKITKLEKISDENRLDNKELSIFKLPTEIKNKTSKLYHDEIHEKSNKPNRRKFNDENDKKISRRSQSISIGLKKILNKYRPSKKDDLTIIVPLQQYDSNKTDLNNIIFNQNSSNYSNKDQQRSNSNNDQINLEKKDLSITNLTISNLKNEKQIIEKTAQNEEVKSYSNHLPQIFINDSINDEKSVKNEKSPSSYSLKDFYSIVSNIEMISKTKSSGKEFSELAKEMLLTRQNLQNKYKMRFHDSGKRTNETLSQSNDDNNHSSVNNQSFNKNKSIYYSNRDDILLNQILLTNTKK